MTTLASFLGPQKRLLPRMALAATAMLAACNSDTGHKTIGTFVAGFDEDVLCDGIDLGGFASDGENLCADAVVPPECDANNLERSCGQYNGFAGARFERSFPIKNPNVDADGLVNELSFGSDDIVYDDALIVAYGCNDNLVPLMVSDRRLLTYLTDDSGEARYAWDRILGQNIRNEELEAPACIEGADVCTIPLTEDLGTQADAPRNLAFSFSEFRVIDEAVCPADANGNRPERELRFIVVADLDNDAFVCSLDGEISSDGLLCSEDENPGNCPEAACDLSEGQICSSETEVSTCVDTDGDGCGELQVASCPDNQTCRDGSCALVEDRSDVTFAMSFGDVDIYRNGINPPERFRVFVENLANPAAGSMLFFDAVNGEPTAGFEWGIGYPMETQMFLPGVCNVLRLTVEVESNGEVKQFTTNDPVAPPGPERPHYMTWHSYPSSTLPNGKVTHLGFSFSGYATAASLGEGTALWLKGGGILGLPADLNFEDFPYMWENMVGLANGCPNPNVIGEFNREYHNDVAPGTIAPVQCSADLSRTSGFASCDAFCSRAYPELTSCGTPNPSAPQYCTCQ